MKKLILIIALPVFIFTIIGCSKEVMNNLKPIVVNNFSPDEDLSIEDIINLNNNNVEINYDPATGFPREIWGLFTTRKIFNVKDAVKCLSSVRSIMHIDQLSFACTRSEKRNDINVFYLQQLYNEIMVYGGNFVVAAKKTGEPYMLNGTYNTGIELETTPKITAKEAKKNISLKKDTKISETILAIYPASQENYRLCWRLTVSARDPLDEKYVFIDANTGELLAEIPLAIS